MSAPPAAGGGAVLPPLPAPDVDSEPFWEAAGRGELVLCRCGDCREWMQPPLERCRHCGAPTAFEPAAGDGTIYSYIVVRHPSVPAYAADLPYVVALVELTEGVRLPGRLRGASADDVAVGQPVRVGFERWPGVTEPELVWHAVG